MSALYRLVAKDKSQIRVWNILSYSQLARAFDISVMALLVVFFVGYVNLHSELIGMERLFPMPGPVEEFWEALSWIIFAALVADLYLKYRKLNDPKKFVKKYWLDVAMLALIPLFAGFKIAKLSVKIVKSMKMTKSGFKVFHSAKKMQKA
jgi:hypothetical protein